MTTPPTDREILLALNDRMNKLEDEVRTALIRLQTLLDNPPQGKVGPAGPVGPAGERGPALDLEPFEERMNAFLADQAARHETLRGELINTARDTQAIAERAVTSVNLLMRPLKGRES